MEIRNVKIGDGKIKRIYENSFPKRERMAYPLMLIMSKLWNTEFLAFYDGDTPCGMIYIGKNFRLVFIMFFAVDEKLRSKGYGTEILKLISRRYPKKKQIVSIEPVSEDENTVRRKIFYIRNGFSETGYEMSLNGVKQEILVKNGVFSRYEFLSFFAHYSNATVWPIMCRKEI